MELKAPLQMSFVIDCFPDCVGVVAVEEKTVVSLGSGGVAGLRSDSDEVLPS